MSSTTSSSSRRRSAVALALGATLVAGACSSSSTSPTPGTTAAPGSSAPSGSTPGTQVASKIRPVDEATMRTVVEETAKEVTAPGTVVLVRTPKGDFTYEWGVREIGSDEKVRVGDHIRIGSNTKTWTGTVILQMVQEGKIGIDDPVSKYLPDVPNGDEITISQLMKMRSGLWNYTTSPYMNEQLDTNPTRAWTPQELLEMAFAEPPQFPPGARYEYSNTNTVIEGLIAEKIDGKPLRQIFQDRLFTPLGMKATQFPESTSNAIPTPHPRGYMYGTNMSTLESMALPEDQQAEAHAGRLKPNDLTDENPSWAFSAGAGISTAEDLVTWVQALGSGGVLDEEWQQKRLDSIEPTNPANPAAPGYGWNIAKMGPLLGHTGELPGFNSFMGYDPDSDVTIVVWTNLSNTPDGDLPAVVIARALMAEIYGTSEGAGAPSGADGPTSGSTPGKAPGTTAR